MFNTILQVEDDPNDVFLFERAMRNVGVTNPIQVATDGQQAIDYLTGAGRFGDREKFPLPCLVLLDLKLPHVMGLDVLKWIRQQSGSPRVVLLMSASDQEADIAEAYRLGANGYLVKPSHAGKFRDMARAIKDFWLTHNLCPPENPMEGVVSLGMAPADLAETRPMACEPCGGQHWARPRGPRSFRVGSANADFDACTGAVDRSDVRGRGHIYVI